MYVFTCFICKNSRLFLRAKIRKKQQTERPCPKKQHFMSTNALYGINPPLMPAAGFVDILRK